MSDDKKQEGNYGVGPAKAGHFAPQGGKKEEGSTAYHVEPNPHFTWPEERLARLYETEEGMPFKAPKFYIWYGRIPNDESAPYQYGPPLEDLNKAVRKADEAYRASDIRHVRIVANEAVTVWKRSNWKRSTFDPNTLPAREERLKQIDVALMDAAETRETVPGLYEDAKRLEEHDTISLATGKPLKDMPTFELSDVFPETRLAPGAILLPLSENLQRTTVYGIQEYIDSLHKAIANHKEANCAYREVGAQVMESMACQVRADLGNGGVVRERTWSCAEDFMFLYSELGKAYEVLFHIEEQVKERQKGQETQ